MYVVCWQWNSCWALSTRCAAGHPVIHGSGAEVRFCRSCLPGLHIRIRGLLPDRLHRRDSVRSGQLGRTNSLWTKPRALARESYLPRYTIAIKYNFTVSNKEVILGSASVKLNHRVLHAATWCLQNCNSIIKVIRVAHDGSQKKSPLPWLTFHFHLRIPTWSLWASLDAGLSLVETDHVTRILASDWSRTYDSDNPLIIQTRIGQKNNYPCFGLADNDVSRISVSVMRKSCDNNSWKALSLNLREKFSKTWHNQCSENTRFINDDVLMHFLCFTKWNPTRIVRMASPICYHRTSK